MAIDATEMYLIPLHSWRRAQQYHTFRSEIGQAVVEESDIEFWDHQDPLSAFSGPSPPE